MSQLTVENTPMVARERVFPPTNQVDQLPPGIERKQTDGDFEDNNFFDEFGCPNMYFLPGVFNSSSTSDETGNRQSRLTIIGDNSGNYPDYN